MTVPHICVSGETKEGKYLSDQAAMDQAGLGGFSVDLKKQLQSDMPISLSCQLDRQRSLKVELHFKKDNQDTIRPM